MSKDQRVTVHGTAVALASDDGAPGGDAGVLLRGRSGSGKSDLALRLIDGGGLLVADDQTVLTRDGETIRLDAPETIARRLEVRGLGIVPMETAIAVPLVLVVDLVAREAVVRLPEPASVKFLEINVPLVALDPFEISAAAKVRLAVRAAARGILQRLD